MRFCILIVLAEIDNVLLPFSHANYTSEHTLMVMSYNRLYNGWETPRISLTDGVFILCCYHDVHLLVCPFVIH